MYIILAAIIAFCIYKGYMKRNLLSELNSITKTCSDKLQSDGYFPHGNIISFEYVGYNQVEATRQYTAVFNIGDDKDIMYGIKVQYERKSSFISAIAYQNIVVIKENNTLSVDWYEIIGNYSIERVTV